MKHVDMATRADPLPHVFSESGFLILLDVPQGTEVGIDFNYWSVGPRFRGIKLIPPGFHFVYYRSVEVYVHTYIYCCLIHVWSVYIIHVLFTVMRLLLHSAVNKEGQSAPRTGFFHFFKKKEVFWII